MYIFSWSEAFSWHSWNLDFSLHSMKYKCHIHSKNLNILYVFCRHAACFKIWISKVHDFLNFELSPMCTCTWLFLSSLQSFVIFVTMCREALDDFRRYRRDKEANSQKFKTFTRDGVKEIPSSKIKVGDLIFVEKVSFFFRNFWQLY